METLDDILLDSDDKMSKALEYLQQELAGLRTGKASPSLVDHIAVDYYGAATRLREIAGISTPEPRLIVINAYDPSALPAIEKAILAANIGVTPISDGRLIRIPIPELTEERRRELTKVAKRQAEEQRVAVRNVRRDANEAIKNLQKSSKITEDERDSGLEEIQKYTDDYIKKIDALLAAKEKDIMQV
ncbi:MAG TPA: ribosome recycling factor [Kiritimatiellia bacterium]|nr:ribosome recycling factor [Kiritimatiellia bacterium]HNR93583.1 ribosome recycling factor [Kiritimatiellia bacterium]HNS80737.1 ribosome recycling factor [Kiritimatiellia bacterium]HPA77770.1 ribosome recycling factor [Kiritimatiellia bacterium]HQQ04593.1 ribosome recycling factor [Kiritimatiellia bacterium]